MVYRRVKVVFVFVLALVVVPKVIFTGTVGSRSWLCPGTWLLWGGWFL